MLNRLLSLLFACRHSRVSWPQSPRRGQPPGPVTVSCLDCGRRMVYPWRELMEDEPRAKYIAAVPRPALAGPTEEDEMEARRRWM